MVIRRQHLINFPEITSIAIDTSSSFFLKFVAVLIRKLEWRIVCKGKRNDGELILDTEGNADGPQMWSDGVDFVLKFALPFEGGQRGA